MYLNFELLYNINEFLFPLFYYKLGDSFKVYSPMTLRHITIYYSGGYLKSAFFDLKYGKDISDILYYFTLEQQIKM